LTHADSRHNLLTRLLQGLAHKWTLGVVAVCSNKMKFVYENVCECVSQVYIHLSERNSFSYCHLFKKNSNTLSFPVHTHTHTHTDHIACITYVCICVCLCVCVCVCVCVCLCVCVHGIPVSIATSVYSFIDACKHISQILLKFTHHKKSFINITCKKGQTCRGGV
jgi:hypothetical protein